MTLTQHSEEQIQKLAAQNQEGFLDNLTGAFFRRIDWWAFWIVLAVTLAVYVYTLAPTVTLEDGGELAVASDFLGVPHPPGYPIWTLVTWFFQWVFHWVTYNGYPNPSWSVGLASAVAGAGACGLLALLISRSGADLLRSVPELKEKIGFQAENLLCLAAGISGGLLLAFSPVLWSQSVIVEAYSLNAFFQMVVLLLLYMWMCRPKDDTLLYAAAFLFGLGLTNHQTLLFLGLALALAVVMKDADLFRDFAISAIFLGLVFVLSAKGLDLYVGDEKMAEIAQLGGGDLSMWKWSRGPDSASFWIYNFLFLSIPTALAIGTATKGLATSKRALYGFLGVGAIYLVAVAACAFFTSAPAKLSPSYGPWLFNSVVPTAADQVSSPFAAWLWSPAGPGFRATTLLRLLMLLPFGLVFLSLPHGKTVAATILLAQVGVAFYLYLPIASEQNPPMNWGYARTWEGFMHSVTRGQYEAIVPTDIFSEKFIQQLGAYLTDLRQQFSLPVAVLGFLPFCAWGFAFAGKRRSVFPVALGLVLASSLLIILETVTGWTGFESVYRLLIAPILLIAVWGFFVLVALYLKKQISDLRHFSWGTRIMIGGFLLGILAAVLWVDVMSLKALFGGELSGTGKWIYGIMVFGPPAAVAAAWILNLSPLKLDFDLGAPQQRWLITSVVGFFSVSVVFLIFQNPQLDIQTLFIGRVQFIQSHAFYALWLGYGVLLSAAWVERLLGQAFRVPVLAAGLLLPGILLWQNAYDEEQLRIVGGAEQNNHHFGWQFGHWSLEGIKGIEHDFKHWYPDPEEFQRQWDAFPTKDYPPPMTEGAIFYGGTDPGRFVPTYMIYSADCRRDVYLITQNALADNTFMNITRDLYGDTIYIPSLEDSNEAFRKYVEDVQAGRTQAGADIKIEGGKVSVQGVGGVMTINGILAELIFKENKARHDFYVEESYVIQWMYPYLTPHGIILKLNDEPLAALPPDVVANDHAFWGWYTPWLLEQSEFRRDICARKSFSKLRSAIAGIYDYRRMYDEAEYAFKQSIDLYPLSPEANFRLAQMYMNMQRFEEAEAIIRSFVEQDPRNESAKGFLSQIENTRRMIDRRKEIEARQQESGAFSADEALELLSIYRASGMHGAYQQLANRLVSDPNLPAPYLLSVASLFAQDQQIEALVFTLEQYVRKEGNNVDVWLDLAAAYVHLQRQPDAVNAARRAIELGGDQARQFILGDPRFQPLAGNPQFRALFPQQPPRPPAAPAWQGGALPNLPGLAR
jgi:tetratricopeptide (TPR) repeat protein